MSSLSEESVASKRFPIFVMFVLLVAGMGYYMRFTPVLLGDPDTWWHIVTGQRILAELRVPQIDTYSYTFAGQPWIAKEWLSQVILAGAFSISQWNGVIFIATLSAALALVLLYRELTRTLNPVLAAVAIIAIIPVIVPFVIARPHVFTFPLAVFFTTRLFRCVHNDEAPKLWMLGIIVLWTNLHGSFTLGFMIAGFAFMAMLEKTRLNNRQLIGKWLVFLVLCPIVSLLNPYGVQPLLINLRFVNGFQVMTVIDEFLPFNAPEESFIEGGLLLMIGVLGISGIRLGITRTLFLLFTLHMFLNHIRFTYVFFLLVPIVIAPELAKQNFPISKMKWLDEPRNKLENFTSKWLEMIIATGSALALVTFTAVSSANPGRPPPDRTISGALAYIRSHNLTGHVMNYYNFGGPLIMYNVKTYIDGRAEQLFMGDFMKSYLASGDTGGEKPLAEILKTLDVTWTIFPPADTRNKFLAAMPNWKKTYSDNDAVIFERIAKTGN